LGHETRHRARGLLLVAGNTGLNDFLLGQIGQKPKAQSGSCRTHPPPGTLHYWRKLSFRFFLLKELSSLVVGRMTSSRQSAVGSRQSAVGSRQSAVGSRQSEGRCARSLLPATTNFRHSGAGFFCQSPESSCAAQQNTHQASLEN
jgi:hypothetical protein